MGDWRPSSAQRFFWHFKSFVFESNFFRPSRALTLSLSLSPSTRTSVKMDQCHVETRGNDVFPREKYVCSKIPEKWQKDCKTWVFAPGYKKECEIFSLRALQIYSAIKKTDPGDKLCRVSPDDDERRRSEFCQRCYYEIFGP